jgi:hypothetical protein
VIVIDRRPTDAPDQLGGAGIAVHALFTMDELAATSKLRQ